jgi:hypothetical protein
MSFQSLSTRYSGNGALSSLKHTIDGHVTKSFGFSRLAISGKRRGTIRSSHIVREKKGGTDMLECL